MGGVRMGRALPLAAAALLVLGGCATKGDMRTLHDELSAMQQRQDSVLVEIQRQNGLLLDSIRTAMALTVNARGTTTNQLRQFEEHVSELGQLVGQVMNVLNRIDQRVAGLEQRPAGTGRQSADDAAGGLSGGGTADEYYAAGMQKLNEGSFSSARLAFEQILSEYPDHERAPDAQFQLGELHYLEQQFEDAYEALEVVARNWPGAARAPAALFRAGAIAEERRDFRRARSYYERVLERYSETGEARQARQKLANLPGS